MSVDALRYVMESTATTGMDRLMLIVIADHVNGEGYAFPSMARLAQCCNVSTRQAQRIVTRLEERGLIEIERGTGRGHPSRYEIKGDISVQRVTDSVTLSGNEDTERVTSERTKDDSYVSPIQRERVTSGNRKGDIRSHAREVTKLLYNEKQEVEEEDWKILLAKLGDAGVFIDSPMKGDMYADLLAEVGLRPILDTITDGVRLGNGRVHSFAWIAKVARGKFHGNGPTYRNGNGAGAVDTTFAPPELREMQPRQPTIEETMWRRLESAPEVAKLARAFGRFEGDVWVPRNGEYKRARQLVDGLKERGIQIGVRMAGADEEAPSAASR